MHAFHVCAGEFPGSGADPGSRKTLLQEDPMERPHEQSTKVTELERTLAAVCIELIEAVAPRQPKLRPLLEKVRVQLERVL